VATDFDGTISEIAPTPAAAGPLPGALELLASLATTHGVHVAIVSGRPYADLAARTASVGTIWRVAEHGSIIEAPGRAPVSDVAGSRVKLLEALLAAAREICATHQGMQVEAKAAGVAVHLRGVPDAIRPSAIAASLEWERRARALGARVLHGRQVIEAHASDRTKAAALAVIIDATRPDLVVYAGDDETDEGAIGLARQRGGVGVYIASEERPRSETEPDLVLARPQAWVELLEALVARRATSAAP
jgi:trehalose 6-phosphate phosphatase